MNFVPDNVVWIVWHQSIKASCFCFVWFSGISIFKVFLNLIQLLLITGHTKQVICFILFRILITSIFFSYQINSKRYQIMRQNLWWAPRKCRESSSMKPLKYLFLLSKESFQLFFCKKNIRFEFFNFFIENIEQMRRITTKEIHQMTKRSKVIFVVSTLRPINKLG